AVPEGQPRGVEPAGPVADQVDDGLELVGHGRGPGRWTGNYSRGAAIMAEVQVPAEVEPMFNRTTLVVLVAALAAALGFWAAQHRLAADRAAAQLQAVRLFPQPRELPPFSLQQSDGTPLVPGELQGHWTLVFLGFTHCPDVCPTTLAQLAQAQKQWAALPEATRPRVLFVSVDPERDTPD